MSRYPIRSLPTHPQLELIMAMADGLCTAAIDVSRIAVRKLQRKRAAVNTTLRPGLDTPTWTALANAIRPYLAARGEKIKLARWLGLDPARVTEFFGKTSAMPDAERTLLLVQWLALRRAGRQPG